MKWSLFWKALIIFGLSALLMIPLLMIEDQIATRQQRQTAVEADIAGSAAGAQQVTGPILVVWYTERVVLSNLNEKTGRITKTVEVQTHHREFVPKELRIGGDVKVEERHRGLYKAQLYRMNAKMSGQFQIPQFLGIDPRQHDITIGDAYLLLGVTDNRGIESSPLLNWEGRSHEFVAGTHKDVLTKGIQAGLGPMDCSQDRLFRFEIPLSLMGSQDLSIAPVADDTRVSLTSNWANPSFGGRFLPVNHQITHSGFEASWQVSHLARDLDRILQTKGEGMSEESFQVTFMDPVNVYLMSERAVKYGFLFIGLTFAAFFLFEMLKRLPIHPIQYLLVGLSLGLFFLLLISLSEHIRFIWAYVLAASSGVLLLGFYLSHVLKSRLRGMGFALSLCLLYGVLYGLLISEDNALLMGSLLLFFLLGTVMMITRKMDWYSLGASRPEVETPANSRP
jgi:inner membrane protein